MASELKHVNLLRSDGSRKRFVYRDEPADRDTLNEIYTKKCYALGNLRRGNELYDKYQTYILEGKKPLIVDAGAHIGASVVWFAQAFPGCQVVAFEPDPGNFALLTQNTEGLDVELHNAALGSIDGHVSIDDPGMGKNAYRTVVSENGPIELISLSRVLDAKKKQGFVPFMAKIDIEGGEENLFGAYTDWVDEFSLIIIELHDWLIPKQGTSRNFLRCISEHDRDFVYMGENIFSIKNS